VISHDAHSQPITLPGWLSHYSPFADWPMEMLPRVSYFGRRCSSMTKGDQHRPHQQHHHQFCGMGVRRSVIRDYYDDRPAFVSTIVNTGDDIRVHDGPGDGFRMIPRPLTTSAFPAYVLGRCGEQTAAGEPLSWPCHLASSLRASVGIFYPGHDSIPTPIATPSSASSFFFLLCFSRLPRSRCVPSRPRPLRRES